MVTFGQVVRNVDVHERNALANGIDRYVGLDHLEPGNLHVRNWGSVADGTTFTRRFKPGQVLFGKRRAYQRKAAFTEFEGICSGDILVFEPSGDELLPELLPFIVESDGFFAEALRTSAGSLSPRTKWKELAEYRFPLPPREEQHRIADILWAADAAVERWRGVLLKSEDFRRRLLRSRFEEMAKASPTDRLDRLGQIQLGRQRAPKYQTGHFTHKYLRVVNVLDGELDLRDVGEMDFDPADFERYALQDGDILITEGDLISPLNVGRSAVFHGELPDCCFQNTLIRFRVGPRLSTSFAHAALQNAFYCGVLASVASTTTVTHLGAGRLSSVQIAVPSRDRQDSLVNELNSASDAIKAARRQSGGAEELTTALRIALLG